jgi:hypothetical protein
VCTFEAAIHEAGHAFVAIWCGYKIKSVWVKGDKGACETHPRPVQVVYSERDVSVKAGRRSLMLDVSGWIAEELHVTASGSEPMLRRVSDRLREIANIALLSSGSDASEAFELAYRIADHECRMARNGFTDTITHAGILREIERAETRTRRILTRYWHQVVAVASALSSAKNGRLTGKQVNHAIASSRTRPGPSTVA